jgi:hypothetical protein
MIRQHTGQPGATLPTADAARVSGSGGAATFRMLEVFVRPRSLFERLRSAPEWIAPMVAAVAVGILVIVALPDAVFVEGMQGATTRRGVPVDIVSAPETVALWERLRLSLGVAVTHPVKALILAGVLLLVFTRLAGGQAGFREYFAATSHAFLIGAAGALVALAMQLGTGDIEAAARLAEVAPGLMDAGVVLRAIGLLNPFTVWMLAVLGLGVGVLNRRPAAPAVAALLGGYAIMLLALAAFGAA